MLLSRVDCGCEFGPYELGVGDVLTGGNDGKVGMGVLLEGQVGGLSEFFGFGLSHFI